MVLGNDIQENHKTILFEEKLKCEERITAITTQIQEINNIIADECIKKHGNHHFKQDIETSMYGEVFYTCKNCGYEA
jgi:hypothetical protein